MKRLWFLWLPVLIVAIAAQAGSTIAGESGALIRHATPFPAILDPAPDSDGAEGTRYHVLRGDFHIHTPHSDGEVSPRDRVVEAWKYGYDVMAITDHGTFKAYEEAAPVADALGMVLLRGMETGIKDREHLVALGFSADYVPRDSHKWTMKSGRDGAYYREQWKRLGQAGGFVLYAHPHVGFKEPTRWALEQGLLGGLEVKNGVVGEGWHTTRSHGTNWYPAALDWAIEHKLAVFANSDIHARRGDHPQPVTLVLSEERTVESVLEALRAGRTIAQFNDMLCAREELLALLIDNLVDVRFRDAGEGQGWLSMENRSPVALEATVKAGGTADAALTLGPYDQRLLPRPAAARRASVVWKNLWIGAGSNLVTVHTPQARRSR